MQPDTHPESMLLRRPTTIARPEDVVSLITSGYCDSVADDLRNALDARKQKRRQDVIDSVREVFGDAAADDLSTAAGLDI